MMFHLGKGNALLKMMDGEKLFDQKQIKLPIEKLIL